MQNFEVVVIGGGMVGACTALGFAQQGRRVALIEHQVPLAFDSQQPYDLRVSAISQASVDILNTMGVWDKIAMSRICPYRRLDTWESPDCRTQFSADSLGLDQLGFMVENRLIQLGLWAAFDLYSNLVLFCPDRLSEIEFGIEENIVSLESGEQISASWVIGADGANSKVRQLAGIGLTAWDYRQHCMLINVETEMPQQDITWQQFSPSGPHSFLPLQGNQASLVWYDSPRRIAQLNTMSNIQLRNEIVQHFPQELGDVKVLQHGSFPLTRRHAHSYVKRRCVLVGDAAHTINPLAGQGVNLGFKDVQALLENTFNHEVLELKAMLTYQRARRADNLFMQAGMDLFYAAFSNTIPPLMFLRNAGLKLANKAGPIKNSVLRYALGLS
jgi:3-demethoxyubiquinol 3-hydroxylase